MTDATIRKDLAAARRDLGNLKSVELSEQQQRVVARLVRILDWGDAQMAVETAPNGEPWRDTKGHVISTEADVAEWRERALQAEKELAEMELMESLREDEDREGWGVT